MTLFIDFYFEEKQHVIELHGEVTRDAIQVEKVHNIIRLKLHRQVVIPKYKVRSTMPWQYHFERLLKLFLCQSRDADTGSQHVEVRPCIAQGNVFHLIPFFQEVEDHGVVLLLYFIKKFIL